MPAGKNAANLRAVLLQVTIAAFVTAGLVWLFTTSQHNLTRLGVQSGFGFLTDKAGFSLPQTLIHYSDDSTMLRAILAAALNTALIVVASILLASALGMVIALARISQNGLVAVLGAAYVEIFRNVPVLLQIFFFYYVVIRVLPGVAESVDLGGLVVLNNRGLYLPWVTLNPLTVSTPIAGRFNYEGGLHVMPEFLAVWIGLSMYNASYIGEIVRSGFLAVPQGQADAAIALGFSKWQTIRLITLPLAMRVIIPPLTTVYVNIFKGSSLGAAIAYPELVSVLLGTINNLVGQPLEVMAIALAFFVSVSLLISFLMNRFNARVQLKK